MKKQLKCQCGKPFWTSLVKVWVFKQRLCNQCKGPLTHILGYLRCPKCKLAWSLKDQQAIAKLGVKMMGTTRDFKKAEATRRRGIEVDKFLVPKKQACQRCRNMQTMIRNMGKKSGIKNVEKLSQEQIVAHIRQQVKMKHAQELQVRRQLERQKAQQKAMVAKAKPKKKQKKPVLLTTPFNVDKKELTENEEDEMADEASQRKKIKKREGGKYKSSRRGKG